MFTSGFPSTFRGSKDELGREALSETSSLSPAPSDGRQQTRIHRTVFRVANRKNPHRWVSKTCSFQPGNWKVTIENLFFEHFFLKMSFCWRVVVFFLQIAIFEVQSEFDPTAVRAQIEACWKRQLHWLLEDSDYNIRCLYVMWDVKFFTFEEKRIQIGYLRHFLLTDDVYRTWWKFGEAWFVQCVELYIQIYHQALLAKKNNIYSQKSQWIQIAYWKMNHHSLSIDATVKNTNILLTNCWWKKSCTTSDVHNLINNGINYQPQLVQDSFHQRYVYNVCPHRW